MQYTDLTVYKKSLEVNSELKTKILTMSQIDRSLKDQLRRASNSITLNIAEGSSRFSPADRKNFFVIARGSAFECASVLDLIEDSDKKDFLYIKNLFEEISKMLFKMITNLKNQIDAKKWFNL